MVVMKTYCNTLAPCDVSVDQADAMWTLFQSTYSDVQCSIFEEDYRKKDIVLLLWEGDVLAGFTSLLFKQIERECIAYSGDIVIAPWARKFGTVVFFREWASQVLNKADWWCILTSGVRTYRILHTFFKRITPFSICQESLEDSGKRKLFAQEMYGSTYNPDTGIVKLDHPYRLRDETKPACLEDPVDAFFVKANPGWEEGDELVSLVSMSRDNLKPAALRVLNW